MKHLRWLLLALIGLALTAPVARGQNNSLDILEKDLQQIKNQSQELKAQNLAAFIQALENAAASPDAAFDLYTQAGGSAAPSAPVNKRNVVETPDERAAREAIDEANKTALASVAQLHCGMMRFAAYFVVQPDHQGLNDEWIAWLKSAAKAYPQIAQATESAAAGLAAANDAAGNNGGGNGGGGKRRGGGGAGGGGGKKGDNPATALKNTSMRDSSISKFLNFRSWGDKDQGGWAVRDVPALYRTFVLDPLRAKPSQETLAAWDTYIAMKNADQPDDDKWNSIDYPPLAFERACDDYSITPNMDKLNAAVQILRNNPSHPKLEDMVAHAHQLVDDYRKSHGGGGTPTVPTAGVGGPPGATPNPNESVTTEGDMTVVTLKHDSPATNAPPVPPTPSPAPPAQ